MKFVFRVIQGGLVDEKVGADVEERVRIESTPRGAIDGLRDRLVGVALAPADSTDGLPRNGLDAVEGGNVFGKLGRRLVGGSHPGIEGFTHDAIRYELFRFVKRHETTAVVTSHGGSDTNRFMKYPNRLRVLRKAAGFRSADQFAEALDAAGVGVSPQHIRGLERGRSRMTQDWLERFARVLKCAPVDILPNLDEPGALADGDAGYEAPPPLDVEANSARYGARNYFRDVCQLVKEVYVSEGRPMPDFDLAEVAFDIVSDVPYDGSLAADVPGVQESLRDLRYFLRNPPFRRRAS